MARPIAPCRFDDSRNPRWRHNCRGLRRRPIEAGRSHRLDDHHLRQSFGRRQYASKGAPGYVSCMRSHGVPNFADPSSSGAFTELKNRTALQQLRVSASQLMTASHDWVHLLPAGHSQTVTLQQQPDYLRAAACMRSHGITNFPDPVFSGGDVSFPIPSSIDTHPTQFTQAQQTSTPPRSGSS